MAELFHLIYIQPKWLVSVVGIGAVLIWGIIAGLSRRDPVYYKTFRVVAATLFIMIIIGILYRTLLNRSGTTERSISLIPFHADALYTSKAEYPRMLLMNVLLFVPFGMSMPFLIKEPSSIGGSGALDWIRRHPATATIIVAAIFSLVIEVLQYALAIGNTEIDDLLMNTLGAAIGTLAHPLSKCVKGDVSD